MRKLTAALLIGVLAVAGVGYWGYQQYQARERIEAALANSYNRAFYNTLDHAQNLEVLLAKSLVVADRRQDDKIFTEVWQQASAALDNLTQLPVSDVITGRTAKFLTQLGDFSRNLAQNSAEGKSLTKEQYQTLRKLYGQAGELNSELQKVETAISKGNVSFREMAGRTRSQLGKEGPRLANANFQTIDEKMHGYPTLIYDGPFSDHLEKRKARATGDKNIAESTARKRALDYIDKKANRDFVAQVTGSVEGSIPAYRVELTPRQEGKATGQPAVMDVSRKGGSVIWSVIPREVGEPKWGTEKARQRAKEFLADRGYKNMKASYYQRHDGVVTYNFVAQSGQAIVYPDMIKVSVALDNGEVVATDARGYLMNHHARDLPRPKVTEQEARDLVGRGLKITREGRLAVIPTETYAERLTWEFEGTMDDNTFLIYINALTGEEERILQLFRTDSGTLTM